MKHTTHLSRLEAEAITEPQDAVLISITGHSSARDTHAKITPGAWSAVLHLKFDDVTELTDEWAPPTDFHARTIATFVRMCWDRSIVVHCEAGVSRSAAVCSVLVDMGWEYKNPGIGLEYANPLLVRLLKREFPVHFMLPEQANENEKERKNER